MDDTELERLLMQLLRVVAPAVTAEPPVPARVAGSSDPRASDPAAPAGSGPAGSGSVQPRPAGSGSVEPRPADAGLAGPSPTALGDDLGQDLAVLAAEASADGVLPAVSASEARALIELISARGIAQGELARVLGLEKSTVSRLAAGLERKGWVRRGRDGENQRYVRLHLTPEGRGVAVRVWAAWQSRQARILAALSAEERAGLSAGLRGLVRGLAAEGLLGESDLSGRG